MFKKVKYPSFVGKVHDCEHCGGSFLVTKRFKISVVNGASGERVVSPCPFCHCMVDMNADVNQRFREKLSKFVHSQVSPIKAIKDENVRLPLQHLLDDFNALIEE